MGSDVFVVFDGPQTLSNFATDRMHKLERAWSRFNAGSDVSRLNRTSGWVSVDTDTVTLFERAVVAWESTGGAFDPTVLPSLVASGYGESRGERPGHTVLSAPAISGPAPGMSQIEIDATRTRIRFPEHIGFDPGGIGKGLAADMVAEGLIASGAAAAMVAVGGDVRVAGRAPRNWTVQVESPFDRNETVANLSMVDGAVCTSSVRSKSWIHDKASTHHIIDPRTGGPTDSSIASATVISGEAWMAEALCKAAIMTEPLDAISFCTSHGVEAIIVDLEGIVWTTDTIARYAA